MSEYKVTRYLDNYKPGDIASEEYIEEQERRGNLGDLVTTGMLVFVASEPDAPDYAAMTLNDLRHLAKERGVKPAGRRKADYVEALESA